MNVICANSHERTPRWNNLNHTCAHIPVRFFPFLFYVVFFDYRFFLFFLHIGEKPFACFLCNKSFASQYKLKEHLQRHQDTFTLKCVRCHRRFSDRDKLVNHQEKCRRRRYECHLCGYTNYGLSYTKFKRHMNHHTGNQMHWILSPNIYRQFSVAEGDSGLIHVFYTILYR